MIYLMMIISNMMNKYHILEEYRIIRNKNNTIFKIYLDLYLEMICKEEFQIKILII